MRFLLFVFVVINAYASDSYVPLSKYILKNSKEFEVKDTSNNLNIKKYPNVKKDERNLFIKIGFSYVLNDVFLESQTTKIDDKINNVVPSLEILYKNHSFNFSYYENIFQTDNFDTTFKLTSSSYKYFLETVGFEILLNKIEYKTIFDSYDISFVGIGSFLNHKEDEFNLSYGLRYFKNSQSSNLHEYFVNLDVQPFVNENIILSLGYEYKNYEFDKLKTKMKSLFLATYYRF